MGEVILVRHGQANSDAKDEASYDRLSALGHVQAGWLGDWFRDHGERFDRVISGSLRRHRETAESMGHATQDLAIDPRFDELDYFNLAHALHDTHGVPLPGPEDFAAHAPKVMEAWHRAEIMGRESFAAFEGRVTEALLDAGEEGRRVLCVTSGGVIGMIVRHLLRLDATRMAHVLLPIRNSSVHRVEIRDGQMLLQAYNATPHLDRPERAHARTTY